MFDFVVVKHTGTGSCSRAADSGACPLLRRGTVPRSGPVPRGGRSYLWQLDADSPGYRPLRDLSPLVKEGRYREAGLYLGEDGLTSVNWTPVLRGQILPAHTAYEPAESDPYGSWIIRSHPKQLYALFAQVTGLCAEQGSFR